MADKYRVANGNWNDANSWALSSGGTDYTTTPTTSDNAIFDASTPNGTHTINAISACADLTFTGFTGTLAGTLPISVYGNLVLGAGMTITYSGALSMAATSGTKTITSNGKNLSTLYINGSGGTFQLADDLSIITTMTRFAGTFDANSQTVSLVGVGTTIVISSGFTFYNLTLSMTSGGEVVFSGDTTITGTLSANAASGSLRYLIRSSVRGLARTITAAAVSLSNVDFEDITGAGAAAPFTGTVMGDCGGNSNITLASAVDRYWVGNSGNWSDNTNHWSDSSGGSPGATMPLPQDNVYFNEDSFSSGSQTVTMDVLRMAKNIDWTGVTNTPTWAFGVNMRKCYGNVTLGTINASSSTQSTGLTFAGRGTYTFTTNNVAFYAAVDVTQVGSSSSLSISGDLNISTGKDFSIRRAVYSTGENIGTVNMGSGTITCFNFTATSNGTATINFDSSTIICNGQFNFSGYTSITLNAGTSIIKCLYATDSFYSFIGGAKAYNEVWLAADSGIQRIFGVTGITISTLRVTNTTAKTIKFVAGNVYSVGSFICSGTAGNLITITSATSASHTITKTGGGQVDCDYLDISYSTATPSGTWFAGNNTTNSGNNSGWIFSASSTSPSVSPSSSISPSSSYSPSSSGSPSISPSSSISPSLSISPSVSPSASISPSSSESPSVSPSSSTSPSSSGSPSSSTSPSISPSVSVSPSSSASPSISPSSSMSPSVSPSPSPMYWLEARISSTAWTNKRWFEPT